MIWAGRPELNWWCHSSSVENSFAAPRTKRQTATLLSAGNDSKQAKTHSRNFFSHHFPSQRKILACHDENPHERSCACSHANCGFHGQCNCERTAGAQSHHFCVRLFRSVLVCFGLLWSVLVCFCMCLCAVVCLVSFIPPGSPRFRPVPPSSPWFTLIHLDHSGINKTLPLSMVPDS